MPLYLPLIAFVIAAYACLLLARFAGPLHLLDQPDERKRHDAAVPLVGGIAIILGFGLVSVWAGWHVFMVEAAIPVALVFVTGLVDDARNLRASPKLVAQVLAASLLVKMTGAALYAVPLPFMAGHVDLGWLAAPLTVLMLVAILNAINMIDGLDGLAGGCLAIGALALGGAALLIGQPVLAGLAFVLVGAVCGFLLWNARFPWQKRARVFLGDAGALAIGMILCWLILKLSLTRGMALRVPLTVALAPVAVPVVDLIVVAFWRAAEGRNPMHADRGHSHHLLLEMGLSAVSAVRLIWLASALVAFSTFIAWQAGVQEGRLLGVLLVGAAIHLVWFRRSWLALRKQTVEEQIERRA